jgi:hypothetical protein
MSKGNQTMKKQENNEPWIYNLIGILVFILIVIAIFALFILKQDGSKCVANPIKYETDILNKSNQTGVICSCSKVNGIGQIGYANFSLGK